MDLQLRGKRALVLASSRGLGAGIAETLAAEGAHVMVTGRDKTRLAELCAQLNARDMGGKAKFVCADMAESSAVEALAHAVDTEFDGLDILVNNSSGPAGGPVSATRPEQWLASFTMMVENIISLTNMVLPGMRERKWGRILTLASSGVEQPITNLGLSNTLRSALVGWSKTLAGEIAGDGVTANILIPGRIHTQRVDELDAAAAARTGTTAEAAAAASRASIPIGRYGRVEEFAATAAFLVSGPASYITGARIRCDGGYIKSI